MGMAHDPRQIARGRDSLLARQLIQLEFEVLRQHLPHDDWPAQKLGRRHALAEKRGEVARALNDPLGMVARHGGPEHGGMACARRGRVYRLLDVHQAQPLVAPFANPEQDRVAQQTQRAAPLHPIGDVVHREIAAMARV